MSNSRNAEQMRDIMTVALMNANPSYFDKKCISSDDKTIDADICIYGGTASGVVAAVAAANRGKSVVLLHPGSHLGGMTTGGLSRTDAGNEQAIGGLAYTFYQQAGQHYGVEEEWCFEPKVAQQILDDWIQKSGVSVFYHQFLDQTRIESNRLTTIRLLGGLTVKASVYIDATYEGDLMATSKVTYTVGREGNETYGEVNNGIQINLSHQFDHAVDPYIVEGDPSSGLLPQIEANDVEPAWSGDRRVQSYNFRVCMTSNPDNRIPFRKPKGYDARQYVLCARWLRDTQDNIFTRFDRIRGKDKTDTNNHGAFSSDFIAANYGWPEGNYEKREKIFQDHVTYQQGLHWFMANDPTVPDAIREQYAQWGLARDEFIDTNHWPHQLYVREARRMVSDTIVTEHTCVGQRLCEDSVGMGSYPLDSHHCRRIIRNGHVVNEGDIHTPITSVYPISYRAMIPRRGQCRNLLVPVCVSASHIAFGSIRMEPVFMILGESAGIAASLARDNGCAVQDLPYSELAAELKRVGQVLEART